MAGQKLRLENDWEDVLNKAVRGNGMGASELAVAADMPVSEVRSILGGRLPSDLILERLARTLKLRPGALLDIAHGRYSPQPFDPARWPGVVPIPNIAYDEIANAYLVWNPSFREAVLIDPSGHLEAIEKALESRELSLKVVCVTHAHGDHVGSLGELVRRHRPCLFAPEAEPLPGANLIGEGARIEAAGLLGRSIFIDGHSPGHLAYVFEADGSWPAPVALVGDVLFAGSMGFGNTSYERLRINVREKLLTLPPASLLGPGHGPCTTVAEEREHNPFA
jgi:glyoxylase-like metal-dependent hydrolase (beta-lactamase superfamily II)